ncbi:hypothetical protein ANTQUA_LOCUS2183 [Anthophora quadrimaculata]
MLEICSAGIYERVSVSDAIPWVPLLAPPGILMDVLEQRNDNARVCQIESGLLTQASCLRSNRMELLQYGL